MAMNRPHQQDMQSQPMIQFDVEPEEDARVVSGMCGCCPSTVPTGSVGVVQDLGRFTGIQEPGFGLYCPCIRDVTIISLAVQQMTCHSDCKTKDNVTVNVSTAVQYRILKRKIKSAVFDVVNPRAQMEAFVDNVLRSFLPTLDLDEAFSAKDEMVKHILDTVRASMQVYGYEIMNVLITDLTPDAAVVRAMNEINASRRQREAAIAKGDGEKILKIKNAEAEAEAMHLSGVGLAKMRMAVADGFADSLQSMEEAGITSTESLHLMITTQYLDTLKDFAKGKAAILVPHGTGGGDISSQVRDGFLTSQALK